MKPIISEMALVGHCGLYCGACGAFLKGSCPGCHNNKKASWCKVRTCCFEHGYSSCADCTEHKYPQQCSKFNSFISKIFGFIFHSDRAACIKQIKELGLQGHAHIMAKEHKHTIKS